MAALVARLARSRLGGLVRQAFTPAKTLSLAFLTLGGFLAGVLFWGGFNTVLEATNTEKFCVGCHEMKTNVFEELKGTVHHQPVSGNARFCLGANFRRYRHLVGRRSGRRSRTPQIRFPWMHSAVGVLGDAARPSNPERRGLHAPGWRQIGQACDPDSAREPPRDDGLHDLGRQECE